MEKKIKDMLPSAIEEKVNSLIHALAVLFAIVAFPMLINFTVVEQKSETLISVIIYTTCYFLTFSFSTLYHWFTAPRLKATFKLFDRISIYFFILIPYR